ncbi:uncharacterized protein TNCV_206831 [Trichonephila clavipes]|nr:uncharacterized protein TNCV_206831 [Trichonephila clavipes]
MVERIIAVTIRTTVKDISGSRAGIGFKTIIADLTIGDINLKIEVKMTILIEGTKEIRTKLLRKRYGTLERRSHLYRKKHTKNIFYKQVKKPSTQVITAHGAKRRKMGVVESNIRIRDFKKPWLFHVLANLEYPCILGIDFIGGSKIISDFDRKSLAIQDSLFEDIKVDERNLRVDLSKTKLNVVANVWIIRPQANRTERVNRDLVQRIANYVNEQHDTWDQFLREFAYAIRTALNETTGKTPAELFLSRKLITPFQKLVMVSDGTEFAVGDIDRLFEEARRNTRTKNEKWEKYYNRRRRDVQIKVNNWVLVATHPLSSAT